MLVQHGYKLKVVDAAFVSLRDHEVIRLSTELSQRNWPLSALIALEPEERKVATGAGEGLVPYADKVWNLVSEMRQGRFPVRPVDCNHCDFAGVCRIHAPSVGQSEEG